MTLPGAAPRSAARAVPLPGSRPLLVLRHDADGRADGTDGAGR
ncbi:hypothetical protein [Kitasatospora phosalacinea]|nr:hypothetical protein [Kitasatospora phosalacinea]